MSVGCQVFIWSGPCAGWVMSKLKVQLLLGEGMSVQSYKLGGGVGRPRVGEVAVKAVPAGVYPQSPAPSQYRFSGMVAAHPEPPPPPPRASRTHTRFLTRRRRRRRRPATAPAPGEEAVRATRAERAHSRSARTRRSSQSLPRATTSAVTIMN